MVNYHVPGPGALACTPQGVIYLPEGARSDQLAALYEGLARGEGSLVGALDLLVAEFGPGLESLPPFVLLVVSPGPEGTAVRVACRGGAEVRILDSHGGEQIITGQFASMWLEAAVADVCEVAVTEGSGLPDNVVQLPLALGAVTGAAGFAWSAPQAAQERDMLEGGTQPALSEPADELLDLGATWQELPEEWFGADQEEQAEAPPAVEPEPAPVPETVPEIVPEPVAEVAALTLPLSSAPLLEPTPLQPPTAVIAAPVAPYFGTMYVSTGGQLELGSPIVVGRRPSLEGAGAQPGTRLVTVPSAVQDISRSHLGVHMESGYVIATDLGSVNGTTLRRAGQADRPLNPREGTLIYDGDVLDLGDGVTLNFRGLS